MPNNDDTVVIDDSDDGKDANNNGQQENGPFGDLTNHEEKEEPYVYQGKQRIVWNADTKKFLVQMVDKKGAHVPPKGMTTELWEQVRKEFVINGFHVESRRTLQDRFKKLLAEAGELDDAAVEALSATERAMHENLIDMRDTIEANIEADNNKKLAGKNKDELLVAQGKALREKGAQRILAGKVSRIGGEKLELSDDGTIVGAKVKLDDKGDILVETGPGSDPVKLEELLPGASGHKKHTKSELAQSILETTDQQRAAKLALDDKKLNLEIMKFEETVKEHQRRFELETSRLGLETSRIQAEASREAERMKADAEQRALDRLALQAQLEKQKQDTQMQFLRFQAMLDERQTSKKNHPHDNKNDSESNKKVHKES